MNTIQAAIKQAMLAALLVPVLVGGLASVAFGQSPAIGDAAPEFATGAQWVMNGPEEAPKVADLQGEVIVIGHWGARCAPSTRMLPQLQMLHRQHGSRGLHIYTFERQRSSAAQIRRAIEVRGGAGYPVSAGGCAGYSGTGTTPFAWVIGVTGKIAFVGHPSRPDFTRAVMTELSRVRYVGLGRPTIHADVDHAAKKFVAGKWDSALNAAREVMDDEDAAPEARTDARYLVDKIITRHAAMQKRANAFEAEKRYARALSVLERIVDLFKDRRSEEGTSARATITRFRRSREIRGEMKAEEALEDLQQELATMVAANVPAERRRKEVEKFRERYAGTAAAERASELIGDDE